MGDSLATAGIDGTARLWDVATGRQVLVLSGHSGFVGDVDISPDGTILATGGGDGTVRLWDISPEGPREQATIAGRSAVQSLAYSPDGKWLATTSLDGNARLWDEFDRTEGPDVLRRKRESRGRLRPRRTDDCDVGISGRAITVGCGIGGGSTHPPRREG